MACFETTKIALEHSFEMKKKTQEIYKVQSHKIPNVHMYKLLIKIIKLFMHQNEMQFQT